MMILDIQSKAYRNNPYPYFKKLRADAPISKVKPHGYFAIARNTDVHIILKNPEIFLSSGLVEEPTLASPQFLLFSRGLLGLDRPEHTRLRRLICKAFTPTHIRSFEPKIRSICHELCQKWFTVKAIDFIQDFAIPLPILVMGIEEEKLSDFKRWITLLMSWRNKNFNIAENEIQQMYHYFNLLINKRREYPKDDLISALILSCDQNEEISNEEVLGFIRLLLVAGTDTTTHLLGNAMLALLQHPHVLAQITENTTKISDFVDEVLRFDGPAISISRRVSVDNEILNVPLLKNEIVLPLLASANHDETVFPDPEKFDITRNSRNHLAFGTGIHYCIGAQLAKMQTRIAFEELIHFIKKFSINGDKPLEYIDSFFFRGLTQLHLKINH